VPPGIASFTDSHGVLSGEPLYVIGYPGPGTATAEPALTSVKILGSQKTVFSAPTIAIEGAILSGNNGGPLLDSSGGVIGVVLANATQTYAATGGRADAVGLVSPSETLQRFLQEHGVDGRAGLKIPPKSEDRLLIDARPFMVQVGCWW
jgi:S1-C subfamily serine protease